MNGRGFLVQVVEDDMVVSRFIGKSLRRQGFRIIGASDGPAAVKQFGVEHPDPVILDIGIPAMDVLEVCRTLREASTVPIFMVTAKNGDREVVGALECGADDYLSKPFSEAVLLARVTALLRRSRPWLDAAAGRVDLDGLAVDGLQSGATECASEGSGSSHSVTNAIGPRAQEA
jgi:DNA-binding response OmpR family regulator